MSTFRQDMPPQGGYAPIHYSRVPHKRVIKGWMLVGGLAASMVYGAYCGLRWKFYMRRLEVEKYNTLIALQPFVLAERDRAYLKFLRVLREEERELMKNKPGWKLGTLYGEPVYKTIPKNEMLEVHMTEYYGHRPSTTALFEHAWADAWL